MTHTSGEASCWGTSQDVSEPDPSLVMWRPQHLAGVHDARSVAMFEQQVCFVSHGGDLVCYDKSKPHLGPWRLDELAGQVRAIRPDRHGSLDLCVELLDGTLHCGLLVSECDYELARWSYDLSAWRAVTGEGVLARDAGCTLDVRGRLTCNDQQLAQDIAQFVASSVRVEALDRAGQVHRWMRKSPVLAHETLALPGRALELVRDCALLEHGEIVCWGGAGTCGDGHIELARERQFGRPRLLSQLHAVQDMHMAPDGGCLVDADASPRCWGRRFSARADDGLSHTFEEDAEPELVESLAGRAKAVAVANNFRCVLATDGQVFCAGLNDHGQLGRGDFTDASDEFVPVTGLDGVIELGVVARSACALESDGRLWCWGSNGDGQLQLGGQRTDQPLPVPASELLLSDVVDFDSDINRSCAARRDGSVICWGLNQMNALGQRKGEDCKPPRISLDHPELMQFDPCNNPVRWWMPFEAVEGEPDPVIDVAVGSDNSCVRRRSGVVQCWGDNRPQGGHPYPTLYPDDRWYDGEPATIAGTTGSVQMCFSTHGCVVLDDGRLACWGDNTRGQLGDGTRASRAEAVVVDGLEDIEQVWCLHHATCARRTDGEVFCWGELERAMLGAARDSACTGPVQVLEPIEVGLVE